MLADLHCHYPMHLLARERDVAGGVAAWWAQLRETLEADLLEVGAALLNAPPRGERWRVDLAGLERGAVGVVCSVLILPFAELDPKRAPGELPAAATFARLRELLLAVERDLAALDPGGERHVIARSAAQLDAAGGRIAFVHCVEGGFHLGPNPESVEVNVAWLAERGCAYVTLAHLLPRGVAANANAIPQLPDRVFDDLFPQPAGSGLTAYGEAAVRALYRHGVAVDISHMRGDAVAQTLALLDALDAETGADPRAHPVLATHVGHRAAGPGAQAYNLDDATLRAIARRGGLAGLMLAQHQLGATATPADSRRVLRAHVDAIAEAVGGHELTAIGSDLDGFVKPTLRGVERAADLATLASWVRADYPADADAILAGNALRVLRTVLG